MNRSSWWLRVLWIAIAVATVALYVPSLIVAHHLLRIPCAGSACFDHQISPAAALALQQHGLSIAFYGDYYTALAAVFAAVWIVLAVLLMVRKPADSLAIFTGMTFVTFGCSLLGVMNAPAAMGYAWAPWAQLFNNEGFVFLFVLLYIFPTGRFVPSWTRWVALATVALEIPSTFFPQSLANADHWPGPLPILPFVALTFTSVFAQIYRYRAVSHPVERQQTKWIVLGAVTALVSFFVANVIQNSTSSFNQTGSAAWIVFLTIVVAVFLLIPMSFAIAILRYRLWDIDALINRTLVYALLTASIALVYVGGVVILQALFRSISGQQSELAIAIATLAVAALFNPWRHRLQRFVDRRFYRRKYDSARTLATFQHTLRDEVEVDELQGRLIAVVHETLQPEIVSLWLADVGNHHD